MLFGIGISIFFILQARKYKKILRNTEVLEAEEKMQYFREMPDEDATPAEAAFLYYFDKRSAFQSQIDKIVSASILNLALKKVIVFEEKEENVLISLQKKGESLAKHEEDLFGLLEDVVRMKAKQKKVEEKEILISMKDIESYAKKHDAQFLTKIEGIEEDAKNLEKEKQNYDVAVEKEAKKWENKSDMYYVASVLFLISMALLFAAIPCFICGIICRKITKRKRHLTQKGINEQEKWKALKRYMEDFSLLKEREVPELVLWEKYLVFATAFGIADKVLTQLKVKYPELIKEGTMISQGYTYLYLANRMNFDRMLLSGMQKAYRAGINQRAARNYSSGRRSWRRLFWWWRLSVVEVGRNGRQIKSSKYFLASFCIISNSRGVLHEHFKEYTFRTIFWNLRYNASEE